MANFYARQPLEIREGIPVFSKMDEYTKNYERISGDHLSHLKKTGENPWIPEYIWLQTEDSTAELIEKYAQPGKTILDVGVGLGRLLSRFPELDRYGMDISFGYLKMLQEMGGIEVCYSKIEDTPYLEGSFDMVVCTDVLEHVFDLSDASRRILSLLKPDGILIVRTPYKEDLTGYLQPDYPYEFVHMRTFDVPSMRLHFEKTLGCKVLETTVSGYIVSNVRRRSLVSDRQEALLRELLDQIPKSQLPFLLPAVLKDRYEAFEINAVITKSSVLPQHSMTYTPKPSEKLAERIAALEQQSARFASELVAEREAAEKMAVETREQLAKAAESVHVTVESAATAEAKAAAAAELRAAAEQRAAAAEQRAAAAEQRAAAAEQRAAREKSAAQTRQERKIADKKELSDAKLIAKLQQMILQSSWMKLGLALGLCRKIGKAGGADSAAKFDALCRACLETKWLRMGKAFGSKKLDRISELARERLSAPRTKE